MQQRAQRDSSRACVDFVSYSGLDETVPPERLEDFLLDRPWFDGLFAILVKPASLKRGEPRYPSLGWMEAGLRPLRKRWMPWALHLCGDLARLALHDAAALKASEIDPLLAEASLVQVNLPAVPRVEVAAANIERLVAGRSQTVVVQVRSAAHARFAADLLAAGLPVAALMDTSCGKGIRAEVWPSPPAGLPTGYAGGITASTAAADARKAGELAAAARAKGPIWLDMESGLRATRCSPGSSAKTRAERVDGRASERAGEQEVFDLGAVAAVDDAVFAGCHRSPTPAPAAVGESGGGRRERNAEMLP